MFKNSQDLLNYLLEGNQLTSENIDYFIENKFQEDLHLDYKHGKILENSKATSVLREYMSAFANSEGGILIVGVDNKKWEVTGTKAPGGDLAEWASRAIQPIVSSFSPTPQFHVVAHPKGEILICIADRSLGFVYCKEGGGLKYYLRNHDQTFAAPEYLVSDIVLGRRSKPVLNLSKFSLLASKSVDTYSLDFPGNIINLRIQIVIENESLVWAENVIAGVIGFDRSTPNRFSNHMISYLEIKSLNTGLLQFPENNDFYNLRNYKANPISLLGPFDFSGINFKSLQSPISFLNNWVQYEWNGAIYILSQGSPPIWYQVKIQINKDFYDNIPFSNKEEIQSKFYNCELISNQRPVIGWENMRN